MSLTDDDKRWMMETFATKADIQRFATKADIEQTFATKADIERTFATKAELERVETSLLTEFHKWASPNEARQRSHAAILRAHDLEMEQLSDRISKLEPPTKHT